MVARTHTRLGTSAGVKHDTPSFGLTCDMAPLTSPQPIINTYSGRVNQAMRRKTNEQISFLLCCVPPSAMEAEKALHQHLREPRHKKSQGSSTHRCLCKQTRTHTHTHTHTPIHKCAHPMHIHTYTHSNILHTHTHTCTSHAHLDTHDPNCF